MTADTYELPAVQWGPWPEMELPLRTVPYCLTLAIKEGVNKLGREGYATKTAISSDAPLEGPGFRPGYGRLFHGAKEILVRVAGSYPYVSGGEASGLSSPLFLAGRITRSGAC